MSQDFISGHKNEMLEKEPERPTCTLTAVKAESTGKLSLVKDS